MVEMLKRTRKQRLQYKEPPYLSMHSFHNYQYGRNSCILFSPYHLAVSALQAMLKQTDSTQETFTVVLKSTVSLGAQRRTNIFFPSTLLGSWLGLYSKRQNNKRKAYRFSQYKFYVTQKSSEGNDPKKYFYARFYEEQKVVENVIEQKESGLCSHENRSRTCYY